ncbi:hypothetical protein BN1221_01424c [Brenneria goodwinii]|uniref:Uncharacterized protein n=1 Tax=Brenneria goodwinii TaxID=1109412 RepID=A0A0G4JTF7_9GAMM|nr:hypothetical protein BN1221_01424c [Brenneria goodwinii]
MSRAGQAFAVIRDGGETEKAADKTVRIFRSPSRSCPNAAGRRNKLCRNGAGC